jgi:hypothetical protein
MNGQFSQKTVDDHQIFLATSCTALQFQRYAGVTQRGPLDDGDGTTGRDRETDFSAEGAAGRIGLGQQDARIFSA